MIYDRPEATWGGCIFAYEWSEAMLFRALTHDLSLQRQENPIGFVQLLQPLNALEFEIVSFSMLPWSPTNIQ